MIDLPSLAIIIDCWKSTNSIEHNSLYNRILFFLENNKNIRTVLLASYNSKYRNNAHWYQGYVNVFFNSNIRSMRDLAHVHKIYNDHFDEFPEEETHPTILNYLNNDKKQLLMHWPWELKHYLLLNPEIKNIYVLGQAWDICVKVRPLGYETLTEIENINILTNRKCVLTNKLMDPDLINNIKWNHIVDDIWKYNHE